MTSHEPSVPDFDGIQDAEASNKDTLATVLQHSETHGKKKTAKSCKLKHTGSIGQHDVSPINCTITKSRVTNIEIEKN